MKKILHLYLLLFGCMAFAQVEDYIYPLNKMETLLTRDVKIVLNEQLADKKVVFLGESEHHIGSDFLAKTAFVKYLVLEKGYTEIAFEADFFALYFDHSKNNLYPFWSRSEQCVELFQFLQEQEVTIWGFDNQLGANYTQTHFTQKLAAFIEAKAITIDDRFLELTTVYLQNRSKASKALGKNNLALLNKGITSLLSQNEVQKDILWYQFLKTLQSDVLINTTHKSSTKGIPIRDTQMASNLNFLVHHMPDKKMIVWLANAHMAKYEYEFMKGETMGAQFVAQQPNVSYHIAFSPIYMPYRKEKWIAKSHEDPENLLHYLPSTKSNYFIDSKHLIEDYPEYATMKFEGMFHLKENKTQWFRHFDALVFISEGEKITYTKN
ncbi:erythromycin esterase [Pustulibacterium marinum]|uniref:Erythromycin esterase n=1 Tax=Pustulibacterium marinum TaxID=1224947 RepID=A0A1I7I1C4_9FLAO|nr:erythromycin esterase family protein [Pustulibacterium marinum]SFU66744.1 erythromycin esterase [Pustulibacterium marinum]